MDTRRHKESSAQLYEAKQRAEAVYFTCRWRAEPATAAAATAAAAFAQNQLQRTQKGACLFMHLRVHCTNPHNHTQAIIYNAFPVRPTHFPINYGKTPPSSAVHRYDTINVQKTCTAVQMSMCHSL